MTTEEKIDRMQKKIDRLERKVEALTEENEELSEKLENKQEVKMYLTEEKGKQIEKGINIYLLMVFILLILVGLRIVFM